MGEVTLREISSKSSFISRSGSMPLIERSSKVSVQLSGVTFVATPPCIIVTSIVACGTVKS